MNAWRYAILWLLIAPGLAAAEPDARQEAKDAATVEALLRLTGVDVNGTPRLKSAVLRYLETRKGTERYVDLVERLGIQGVEDELLRLAIEDSAGTAGVRAATLLLERGAAAGFEGLLSGAEPQASARAAEVLGRVGNRRASQLLEPLVTGGPSRAVRVAAASALGRSRNGQRFLLQVLRDGQLPAESNFAVANALYAAPDPSIREEVAKYLELPAAANSTPLPPIAELVKQSGHAERGKQLFETTATCAKCHKVRGGGKEVGPDLSEIGAKLSREALFVSILDPSAGISHNYESYTAILDDGNLLTGILINRTDQSITLRTAEAIDKTVSMEEVEEVFKSSVSLMPAEIQKTLSVQDLVDVVEYLTTLRTAE